MRTVADKLGVNFIEVFGSVIVGCGGLSAPSDSQRAERSPEERIRGIVSRAFEQAPCILYIRHFELACHSSGQTSNEIRGLAAKIADVLSESLMACERRKLGKLGDDSFSPQVRLYMLHQCSVFQCTQCESYISFSPRNMLTNHTLLCLAECSGQHSGSCVRRSGRGKPSR